MNNHYVERALEQIADRNLLVNLASKRASEISRGSKPLVDVSLDTVPLDIALLEIAEGKVRYELPN
ncbi:MAG: DNA-directed RNA polymerase subunit omega [Lentisphaeraceae bacterium]|nr:DNA-directed RNA polymerase subunit omega [Lentisphaeraceae bacterium]